MVVNDTLCREATLAVGDEIRIGANVLRVFAAPAGVDLAFSFELAADAAAEAASACIRSLSGRQTEVQLNR